MRTHRGFTLIELMVALFITAIMFAIGYGALDQALRSRKEIDQQSARLLAVQRTIRTLEQDFETLQPRPVRNLLGDGYQPAFLTPQNGFLGNIGTAPGTALAASPGIGPGAGNNTNPADNGAAPNDSTSSGQRLLVTFTRGSWSNPAGVQRSELQRVSYLIENGDLVREFLPVLDATPADVPVRRVLLDHVLSLSFQFMDAGHQWQTQWPPSQVGTRRQLLLRSRPVAVKVVLRLEDWGTITRIIEGAG